MPTGPDSHAALLALQSEPTNGRPALIDRDLRSTLDEYLAFRHVFRSHYSFELNWDFMAPLVDALPDTLERFERSARAFIDQVDPTGR